MPLTGGLFSLRLRRVCKAADGSPWWALFAPEMRRRWRTSCWWLLPSSDAAFLCGPTSFSVSCLVLLLFSCPSSTCWCRLPLTRSGAGEWGTLLAESCTLDGGTETSSSTPALSLQSSSWSPRSRSRYSAELLELSERYLRPMRTMLAVRRGLQ